MCEKWAWPLIEPSTPFISFQVLLSAETRDCHTPMGAGQYWGREGGKWSSIIARKATSWWDLQPELVSAQEGGPMPSHGVKVRMYS